MPDEGLVQDDEMFSAILVMSAEGEMLDNEVRVVPADWVKPAEGVVPGDEVVSVDGMVPEEWQVTADAVSQLMRCCLLIMWCKMIWWCQQ